MPDQTNLALVLRLRRQGWKAAQIAALLQMDEAAVLQLARGAPEARGATPGVTAHDQETGSALQVRLSVDAQRLELWLPPDALSIPTEQLAAKISDRCTRLGLSLVIGADLLAQRMRSWVYGAWLTILESEPPTPPTPDHIEVLVPVRQAGRRWRGPVQAVRRGAVLARRHVGQPGRPGRNFLGEPIAPPAQRATPLPQGDRTEVSADGLELIAASDGEVIMRNVRLHVLPLVVHAGDLTEDAGALRADAGLVIRGSVSDHCVVQAGSDVHIEGQVRSSRITSTLGTIRLGGPIVGTARDPSSLRAGSDILCVRAVHTMLEAAGDVVVEGEIHYSKLVVGGNLYLSGPLEQCLREVELTVGGGIMAPVPPVTPDPAAPRERRHARIPVAVSAQIALHVSPLAFTPCRIEDLSAGGALCQLSDVPDGYVADAVVQIKFRLPSSPGDVITIARVARCTESGELGLAFLHIMERDARRLAQFCSEELRARPNLQSGSRTDRRSDG